MGTNVHRQRVSCAWCRQVRWRGWEGRAASMGGDCGVECGRVRGLLAVGGEAGMRSLTNDYLDLPIRAQLIKRSLPASPSGSPTFIHCCFLPTHTLPPLLPPPFPATPPPPHATTGNVYRVPGADLSA